MKQKKQFSKPSISYVSMPVQDILSGSDGGSSSTPPMNLFDNATHTEGGVTGGNGGDGL